MVTLDYLCWHVFDPLSSKQPLLYRTLPGFEMGVHWTHQDTFQFATSLNTNEGLLITTYEFQPTLVPPHLLLSSFHISTSSPTPIQYMEFSFSPATFHASFFTHVGVTVFNVQDSKVLLEIAVSKECHSQPGCFSPDGQFFACKTSEHEIGIWQNTPTNYTAWSNLRAQSPFHWFSWSPTSSSILCLGPKGVQLLHLGNCPDSILYKQRLPDIEVGGYLVAYSADGVYIVTAQKSSGAVTVFSKLSGTPHQFTNTDMQIQDIKIDNNTIFVVGWCKLVSWDLEAGRVAHDVQSAKRVVVNKPLVIGEALASCYHVNHPILSPDCSWIAFAGGGRVFLHNVKTQKTVYKVMNWWPEAIRFSLDGHQLWFLDPNNDYHFMGLEVAGDQLSAKMVKMGQEDEQLLFNTSPPHGYNIGVNSAWVTDSRGIKLLWLPLNWRIADQGDMRCDNNFLAMVGPHLLEPVIIEFQL